MKQLLILLLAFPFMATTLSYDFGTSCADCEDWFVVLDGVMGGLSTGDLRRTENSFILEGAISLENNGGFASMRTIYGTYDLSQYQTVKIRYRSKGQDFGFTLNKYKRFWLPNFKANLPITDGDWKEVTLELRKFGSYRLGKKQSGNPDAKDLEKIVRLGFISNTKAATSYFFEVDFIKFE